MGNNTAVEPGFIFQELKKLMPVRLWMKENKIKTGHIHKDLKGKLFFEIFSKLNKS
jgi:hypothetical protein